MLLEMLHWTKKIYFLLMTFESAIFFYNQTEMVGEMIPMDYPQGPLGKHIAWFTIIHLNRIHEKDCFSTNGFRGA